MYSKWLWVQADDNPNMGNWICAKCCFSNKNIQSVGKNANPHSYKGTNYCPNCGSKMLSSDYGWTKLNSDNDFPKTGENVIVTIKDESGDNVYYYTDVGWWTGIDNMFMVDNDMCYSVTHWRNMPEPCEE